MRLPAFSPAAPQGNALFLDGISDPGNLGTMIRTAVAADFRDIYLAGCADPFSPKAVRASMSGIYFARLYEGRAEDLLGALDLPLIAADMKGKNLFSFRRPRGLPSRSAARQRGFPKRCGGVRRTLFPSPCGKKRRA